jgi:hypothetical protein
VSEAVFTSGHDGVREYFRDLEDAWGMRSAARSRRSLISVRTRSPSTFVWTRQGERGGMPLAQVVRWRDGLVVYFKVYAHREDALRDLGISEDSLKRIGP